jgi:protein TonB
MAPNEKHGNLAATAASRVQPLPLEVPITITGGPTVEGSDKREPFSESTTTVLVLAEGTVIRVSAALVPGQRVSLFNEKTKREIVCKVVKSKPAGSTSQFVELQFTEPIASFWGLLIRGAAPASIPASPVVSVLATPAATFSPPAKAAAATAPLSATRPVPATRQSIASPNSVPKSPVAPPPPVATVPRTQPAQPVSFENATSKTYHTPVPPPAPSTPKSSPAQAGTAQAAPAIPPPVVPKSVISTSGLLDFSKEIDAILAGQEAPGSPQVSLSTSTPHPSPAASMPTVEQLKLLAARLQADLRSLPFTSTLAAPPLTGKPEPPAAETAKTVIEIPWLETKPAVKSEPVDGLLRQKETLPPVSVEAVPNRSSKSELSFDALAVDAPRYPQAEVFDEQSLGEPTVLPGPITWVISNKRLSLGLAAVALLVLGFGSTRYFRQNRSGTATPVTTSSPLSSPSPVVFSQPAENFARDPSHSASAHPPKPRVSNPVPGVSSPVEPAYTPAIHNFPLAAPVLNPAAGVQQAGDDMPAFATNSPASGSDLLTVGGSVGPKGPVAPPPVGGDVKSAQLIKSVPPVYPQLAKAQGVFGNVEIDALIDASGNVATLKVLSGPMILRQAALDSVKQWKFSPALLDGQPTSMHIVVTVQFRTQ